MPKLGVVIGKFYPPHAGHEYVIRTAFDHCDRVAVIVCATPEQRPSGEQRAAWLRELFPRAEVHLTPDDLPGTPEPWAIRTQELLGENPTHVFSSESYGPTYAGLMGAESVLVDLDRTVFPVSGTAIRLAPIPNWRFLSPPVRGYYARRVILVGAESTGKSSLTKQLAERFETTYVEEYGREYTEKKYSGQLTELGIGEGYEWTTSEFVHIAEVQQEREEQAARASNGLVFADTNAFATGIWHERYKGFRDPETDAIGNRDLCDLYLIPDVDLPFAQDGVRDGEKIRGWMHQTFREEIRRLRIPYAVVRGHGEARLESALRALALRFGVAPRRGQTGG